MNKKLLYILTIFIFGCRYVDISPVGDTSRMIIIQRGFLDAPSFGLDRLGAKLMSLDSEVIVASYLKIDMLHKIILENRPHKLFLIGHSFGADNSIQLAAMLKKDGIFVNGMFLLDSTFPLPITDNVLFCQNYYVNNILGNRNIVVPEIANNQSMVVNVPITNYNHLDIDDASDIHDSIVDLINGN